MRFSRIGIAFGAALAAACFVLPQATQAGSILDPDGQASTGHIASFQFRVQKTNPGDIEAQTVAYVPNEFLVVSDTRDFSFDVNGSNDNGGFVNGPSGAYPRIEVYQMYTMAEGTAGKVNLGFVRAPEGAQTFTNANYPTQPLATGGSKGDGKFNDASFGRYNGHFVFLIKFVHPADIGSGFIKNYRSGLIPGTGCPNNPLIVTTCESIMAGNTAGAVLALYNYNLTSAKAITSAPADLAFGIDWLQTPYSQTSGHLVDYEHVHGGASFRGLRIINSTSSSCRSDGPNYGVINADWDHPQPAPIGGGDGDQESNPQWDTTDTDDDTIGATFYNLQTGDRNNVPDGKISQNYWNQATNIITDMGWRSTGLTDHDHAEFIIRNWNSSNLLYLGGAEFTYDNLPDCTSTPPPATLPPTCVEANANYWRDRGYPFVTGSSNSVSIERYLSPLMDCWYNRNTGGTGISPVSITGHYAQQRVSDYHIYHEIMEKPRSGGGWSTVWSGEVASGSCGPGWCGGTGGIFAAGGDANYKVGYDYVYRACSSFRVVYQEYRPPGPPDKRGNPNPPERPELAYIDNDCPVNNNWYIYHINGGPQSVPQFPADGTHFYFGCYRSQGVMGARVYDPENDFAVSGRFALSSNTAGTNVSKWSTQNLVQYISGGSGDSGPRVNGSLFTSSEINMAGGGTVTDYVDALPEGSDVSWRMDGADFRGGGNLGTNRYDIANIMYRPEYPPWFYYIGADVGGYGGFQAGQQDDPWAVVGIRSTARGNPANNATYHFHKDTRPTLHTSATKQFYDVTGTTPINTLGDGETVMVKVKYTNTGETPAAFYRVVDYIGSTRDFQQPIAGRFTYTFNGVTRTATPTVSEVYPTNDYDGYRAVAANDDRSKTAWRIDWGSNNGVNLPGGQLNPGQTVTLSYVIRAARNSTITGGQTPGIDNGGNYNSALNVGGPNTRQPQDANARNTGSVIGELAPNVHTYFQLQEDYCNGGNRVDRSTGQQTLGQVLAPYVRGGRGNIHSNNSITGYDPTNGNNATFVVTGNGALQHFTGGADQFGNYLGNSSLICAGTKVGDLDWRRQMIKNTAKLKQDPHTKAPIGTTNLPESYANFNSLGGTSKVVEFPAGLTIDSPATFQGVGTIIVNGDLNVKANMKYAADTAINSVGFIVLGNLNIDKSVVQMVGTYYVSDVDWANGAVQLDSNNCPNINPTVGTVRTGNSGLQLNVDGLMIARQFLFERYFVDTTRTNPNDAAENVYYDGRVVAATPPGFGTFNDTKWYEVAP